LVFFQGVVKQQLSSLIKFSLVSTMRKSLPWNNTYFGTWEVPKRIQECGIDKAVPHDSKHIIED
jgi:hypothetical protein